MTNHDPEDVLGARVQQRAILRHLEPLQIAMRTVDEPVSVFDRKLFHISRRCRVHLDD